MMVSLFSRKKEGIAIKEILRGCEVGSMQSVGLMQVIPLLSDLEDERLVSPDVTRVSTVDYGALLFENPTDRTVLVPSQVGYVVKEKAQDHALPGAGFVKAGKKARFDHAMCVQASQAGLISPEQRRMVILPLGLREPALSWRKEKQYNRLWPFIEEFNKQGGVNREGNLITFLRHYKKELDQFVAEFECLPRQVGAIVLVAGEVMGVERAPSQAYWLTVWEPLIRSCYGSHAIQVARRYREKGKTPPRTRVPLRKEGITSLEELEDRLEEARKAEEEQARAQVRDLLDEPFECEKDSTEGSIVLETVRNRQFIGQIAREEERILYASLVLVEGWTRKKSWFRAREFRI